MIKVGSDFSGVGAFNQALIRLGIDYEEVFACDMDKYARQTFIHNYGEPKYYPTNVYDREIPTESLDIYMTSPPCQAFSLAGKRLGKEDKRGILFFNSHEFIQVNKPRFFIFENVKGLLSDDGGKTFSEWCNMLGGKSVNGNAVLFPYEDAVPYHIYWQVLNAKDYGVPQNRERVFIIGIRDDEDNTFQFPKEEYLIKRLKDVLEDDVDEKYFLSEKMIDGFTKHNENHNTKGTGFIFQPKDETEIAAFLRANAALCATDNTLKIGTWRTHEDGRGFREVEDGSCPTIPARAREDGSGQPVIQIKSATSKGYEEATENAGCQQGVILGYTRDSKGKVVKRNIKNEANTIHSSTGSGGNTDQFVMIINKQQSQETEDNVSIGALRGRVEINEEGQSGNYNQRLEINNQGTSNTITSVQKDNVVIFKHNECQQGVIYNDKRLNETLEKNNLPKGDVKAIDTYNKKVQDNAPTLTEPHHNTTRLWDIYKIRRLTPRECFRLMDFPDTFTWPVSDSQAYKQAGNSIVVNVLCKIINNLKINKQ